MNLEKILSISGKPGLYALKIQTRTGFVAESLLDGKKITVGLRSNVSLLSEISMYTDSAEKPLAEVMRNIAVKEDNGPAISHKEDNTTLVTYFKENSCGKCTPCREGTYRLFELVQAGKSYSPEFWSILDLLEHTSFCSYGRSLVQPLSSYYQNILNIK